MSPDDDDDVSAIGRAMLGGSASSDPDSSKIPSPWNPPAPAELQEMLPGYEILKMLGRGGMGAVYMARQRSLDRPVAIKILSGTLAEPEGDYSFAERFKNEARAMAKLSHPGIVAIFDFGETADGLLYIVMEYIDGTDVSRMIAGEGRLHSEHAMAITAHVCDALAYAHSEGIVHRDIKPANIMVGYNGVVKVADFGLAKVRTPDGHSAGLTLSGMAMGTMHFIAPEALAGEMIVDHRADLYAVGAMLYQMLTGKLPHGLFELPSMQVPGLDPRYDKIIAQAMRENREERYQSAGALRSDLDAILTRPVARVEADDAEAAPALPTMARPQRPGRWGARFSPAIRSGEKNGRRSVGWMMILALVASGSVAWWFFEREKTGRAQALPVKPTAASGQAAIAGTATSSPASATKDTPFVNSLGMKFVPVPITGGPTSGKRVLFSIWETRVQDYEKFVAETGRSWPTTTFPQGPTHPAVHASWEDAKAFCAWLTAREHMAGKIATNELYRLPTDHEWSCAAGIGEREDPALPPLSKDGVIQHVYPWGTLWPPPKDAGNYSGEEAAGHETYTKQKILTGYRDDFPETAPVGSFSGNSNGLYDIGGNVDEWCEELVGINDDSRTLRGGGFSSGTHLLSSNRDSIFQTDQSPAKGFRIVLAPGNQVATDSIHTLDTADHPRRRVWPPRNASLSDASRTIAQELAGASESTDKQGTLEQSMLGLWRQYNNGSNLFYHVVLLADGRAGWSEYPKSMEFSGKWEIENQLLVVNFPAGRRYELDVSNGPSGVHTGTGTGGGLPSFNVKFVHTAFEPSESTPSSKDLAGLSFDFTYIDGEKTGTNGLIQLKPDGSVIQPSPEPHQKFAKRVTEWRIENGYLMLIETDKRCMVLFNDFEKKNGKWHLSGQSLQAASVRHQLIQE